MISSNFGRMENNGMAATSYHLNLLRNELQKRQQKNSRFSLRSFAKEIQCSASWLSEVMSEKKGISKKRSLAIAKKLKFKKNESELFHLSAILASTRDPRLKANCEQQINSLIAGKFKSLDLDHKQFESLSSSWLGYLFLELFEIPTLEKTYSGFAQRAGVDLKTAVQVLESLCQSKLLRRSGSFYESTCPSSSTTNDVSSEQIRKHHSNMLVKANESLSTQSVTERDFQGLIFSFDSSKTDEAKLFIQESQRKFIELFCQEKTHVDSVYCFSSQLFRLDQKKGKNL